ncbi:MAG TPA: DUF6325 family protein [Kineosporiaceae bacterium]|nr:DUF6325 family protein [Kineosporiaceae bacterium]
MSERTDQVDELGPIDYLVVEFPGARMTGEGLPLLVDLVDRRIIRILDMVFVKKFADGTVHSVEIGQLDADGAGGLSVFDGARSGLMGADDVERAGAALEAGSAAAILIYENRWAAPLAGALRRSGARLVAADRIPLDAVLQALDAAEASAGTDEIDATDERQRVGARTTGQE